MHGIASRILRLAFMESVISADELSDRLELTTSYSALSADVSASESCSGDEDADSTSLGSLQCRPSGNLSFPAAAIPISEVEKSETGEMSEAELMKERFAKLLLGEDLSGGGKGVCTALAISNAITNLSATIFGELWKLEPLPPPMKSTWCRETEWLLCVSDFIVDFSPSKQEFPGGSAFEVMVTRPRGDLHTNLPALKKLDAMLISILDGFHDSEFYYVDRAVVVADANRLETCSSSLSSSSSQSSVWHEEKWWVPFPKVPPNGLSKVTRKKLRHCRKCTNQILKAAVTMNSAVLAEMDVPNAYLESLPKCGKAYIGEQIYRYLTADKFYPELLLDYLQLSSEHTMVETADRIEAAASIWRHKYLKNEVSRARSNKLSWGVKVKGLVASYIDKSNVLAQLADTLMHNLRLRFPGLPQTALDTSKIQNNKDVGKAMLESYSRVLKNLALNIIARIDDLLYIDDAIKQRAPAAKAQDPYFRDHLLIRQCSRASSSNSSQEVYSSPATSGSFSG